MSKTDPIKIGKRIKVGVCPPLLDRTHFQYSYILTIKHWPWIRPCTSFLFTYCCCL